MCARILIRSDLKPVINTEPFAALQDHHHRLLAPLPARITNEDDSLQCPIKMQPMEQTEMKCMTAKTK